MMIVYTVRGAAHSSLDDYCRSFWRAEGIVSYPHHHMDVTAYLVGQLYYQSCFSLRQQGTLPLLWYWCAACSGASIPPSLETLVSL